MVATLLFTLALIAAPDFKPDQSKLPVPPPKGATVLLDEKGTHQFLSMAGEKIDWPVEDGAIVSTPKKNQNHIVSKLHFKDADIHVEFLLPEKGTGNSGIYIHGNYEVQILNSYGKEKLTQEDAGALYGFAPPLVNACRKPGEWQVFDIRYRAPRRDDSGKIIESGTVTVWFNGEKVQDGTPFGEPKSAFHPFRFGTTPYLETIRDRQKKTMVGPVFLQDHGNPVKFRNVWILPADDHALTYVPDTRGTDNDATPTEELLAKAYRYRDGKGPTQDYAEALRWGHRAADRGDADARDFVGWMFFQGLGAKRNPEIAAGYFKAAAGKSAAAAWNLGQCYFAAQGVDHDVPKALEAWKAAAAMGHGRAASTAAMVYLAGEGIPVDAKEARRLAERAVELNDPSGLVVSGELHFQAGEIEKARALWTKVSRTKPVGATGQPIQPSDRMAARQGADLLKLIDDRNRKSEPGKFALVTMPHIHQGWNNCGATTCAMFARSQGKTCGGWDYKKLCPSPLGTGTDWGDLLKAAGKLNLRCKLVTFAPDDAGFDKATAFVRSELDAGRPLVIDFKYIGPEYPGGEAGHTLALVGYIAKDDLYILCNPAIASPGLELMTAKDLKQYWRSDHYGALSKNVLSRPAIVLDP